MVTLSSILAWTNPWTEEPERATVHGVTKSWTRLSDLAGMQARRNETFPNPNPWTEEPERATVHGVTKSWTRMSDLVGMQARRNETFPHPQRSGYY